MKRPEDLKEAKIFHLKVLSPVHIGTREGALRALEFIYHNNQVHLVDDDGLGRLLEERGAVSRFMEAVQQGPVSLGRFLAGLNIPLDKALPIISRRSIPGGSPQMQEFRPFVRDAMGTPFLPGSAIKGVLRTAVLYRLLEDPRWRDRLEKLVKDSNDLCKSRREKVYFSENLLQKQALQDFSLPQGRNPDPTTDLLRCLTVRDAYPVGPAKTFVVPIDFLSLGKDRGFYFSEDKRGHERKPLRVWIEALFQTTFELKLLWDRELFRHFQEGLAGKPLPVSGLNDLLEAVKMMNRDIAAYEQHFFSESPPPKVAGLKEALTASGGDQPATQAARSLREWYSKLGGETLRLGFGSGMLSTTVGLRLPSELRQKVRDRCGSGPRPGEAAPKSRRVWRQPKDEKHFPLGWLRLAPPAGEESR